MEIIAHPNSDCNASLTALLSIVPSLPENTLPSSLYLSLLIECPLIFQPPPIALHARNLLTIIIWHRTLKRRPRRINPPLFDPLKEILLLLHHISPFHKKPRIAKLTSRIAPTLLLFIRRNAAVPISGPSNHPAPKNAIVQAPMTNIGSSPKNC